MKIKIISYVLSGILIGFILYGSFQYYFKKPTPIVNNTTVQPGANLNVKQGDSKDRRLITSIYGSTKKDIGVSIGWLW